MKMISSTCSKCMPLSHLQKKAFAWLWNVIILAHICVSVIPRVQWSHIQTYIQRVHFLEKNADLHLSKCELSFNDPGTELSCTESIFHPKKSYFYLYVFLNCYL